MLTAAAAEIARKVHTNLAPRGRAGFGTSGRVARYRWLQEQFNFSVTKSDSDCIWQHFLIRQFYRRIMFRLSTFAAASVISGAFEFIVKWFEDIFEKEN